jgi:N-acetylglucosaminyldiphosphoundecaprenol N-acetyl-beta-D-mannosaminyltransferase
MNSFILSDINLFNGDLANIPETKQIIATLNSHSFIIAQEDKLFARAILNSDIILPDGISIVYAIRFLTGRVLKKIAGSDLFVYGMNRLNRKGGSCFFLGSSELTLDRIRLRASIEYQNVRISSYSPPYKPFLTLADNEFIIQEINSFQPDVLFVGMTVPKQEKWVYENHAVINAEHICSIGAVFDFYAGTKARAPKWMINSGLEWFHRLMMEPRRLWNRYLIGNAKFVKLIFMEKIKIKSKH